LGRFFLDRKASKRLKNHGTPGTKSLNSGLKKMDTAQDPLFSPGAKAPGSFLKKKIFALPPRGGRQGNAGLPDCRPIAAFVRWLEKSKKRGHTAF